MKLSEWAKKHNLTYITAYRMFKNGQLPVQAIQTTTGTIMVEEENLEKNTRIEPSKDLDAFIRGIFDLLSMSNEQVSKLYSDDEVFDSLECAYGILKKKVNKENNINEMTKLRDEIDNLKMELNTIKRQLNIQTQYNIKQLKDDIINNLTENITANNFEKIYQEQSEKAAEKVFAQNEEMIKKSKEKIEKFQSKITPGHNSFKRTKQASIDDLLNIGKEVVSQKTNLGNISEHGASQYKIILERIIDQLKMLEARATDEQKEKIKILENHYNKAVIKYSFIVLEKLLSNNNIQIEDRVTIMCKEIITLKDNYNILTDDEKLRMKQLEEIKDLFMNNNFGREDLLNLCKTILDLSYLHDFEKFNLVYNIIKHLPTQDNETDIKDIVKIIRNIYTQYIDALNKSNLKTAAEEHALVLASADNILRARMLID